MSLYIDKLKRDFDKHGYVVIDHFFSSTKLDAIEKLISFCHFIPYFPPNLPRSKVLLDDSAITQKAIFIILTTKLTTLINDVVQKRVSHHSSSITRYTKEGGEFLQAHNDLLAPELTTPRYVAYTIDLSFQGASDSSLEILDKAGSAVINLPAGVPGRICLFKISDQFQHQVTKTRTNPRTVLSGWFGLEKEKLNLNTL